ncbi:arylsulfotransferase family protein [Crateriforma spongiae]|uniref:arylsulfotransferase family protein n=1 Tax=Crateriforma spongiae TaxID=2724528 RepID=UPI001444D01D|nr:arylsulfotransferase family protein [Crateriforma spongiae]
MSSKPVRDRNDFDDKSPFQALVLRARWAVLLLFVLVFGLWYGSRIQKKLDDRQQLTPFERIVGRLRDVPEHATAVIQDPDVVRNLDTEPETALPPGTVSVVGVDTIPVPKDFLYSRYHQDSNQISVIRRRLADNHVVHRWDWSYDDLASRYKQWLKENQRRYPNFSFRGPIRFPLASPLIVEGGRLVTRLQQSLCCFDPDGTLLWQSPEMVHHSVEVDHDGNLWTCSMVADQEGFRDDVALKIDATNGQVLQRYPISEIFQANPEHDYSHHARSDTDPFHLNDVQPVRRRSEFWEPGDVFLSLRNISSVLLFRPSTGKVLWSNAVAWSYQHDVTVVSDHQISVFDNNVMNNSPWGSGFVYRHGDQNRCMVYDFNAAQAESVFQDIFVRHNCKTPTQGRVKWWKEDAWLFIEASDQSFFVAADLDSDRSYKFVCPGNRDGKVGHVAWFRLMDPS